MQPVVRTGGTYLACALLLHKTNKRTLYYAMFGYVLRLLYTAI